MDLTLTIAELQELISSLPPEMEIDGEIESSCVTFYLDLSNTKKVSIDGILLQLEKEA